MSTPAPSAMSRMLSGRPLWPQRPTDGSTSTVLFRGRKVILYFCVGGLTFAGAMYGLTPPIGAFPYQRLGNPHLLYAISQACPPSCSPLPQSRETGDSSSPLSRLCGRGAGGEGTRRLL